jgi:hypothetical protein
MGFFEKVIFEIPSLTATQVCMDLALYFRALDGEERLTDYWRQFKKPSVETLFLKHGKTRA